jgi:hypothetical protein
MQTWLTVFVVVAAVAIVIQMLLLFAFYLQFRRLGSVLTRISGTLELRLSPLLERVENMLQETEGQMHNIIDDTAEVVRIVKSNGQRFDRVLEDGADRLRLQIIRADRMVTGALEAVEDTGAELRQSVLEPVRTVVAFIRGVEAGVNFLRGRSRTPERRRGAQDEGLFI